MTDENGKKIVLTDRQQLALDVMHAAILGYIIGMLLMGIAYLIIMP